MTNPAYCLPADVASAVNVSNATQITTAEDLITDVGAYVPLTMSWSSELRQDEETYYEDTMYSVNPAKTAKDYAFYSQASAAMSSQTGALSNLIQSEKMAVSYENQNLKEQYDWVNSLTQYTQIYCMLLRLKQ